MVKVTAIIGSPRKGGNGDLIVDETLKALREENVEINKYYLDKYLIEPCHACNHCGEGIDCVTLDDGAKIIDELQKSDITILTTPIYYGQMSAQTKKLIDRFYSVSKNPLKSFKGKLFLIFTHTQTEGVYDSYIELTENLFKTLGWDLTNTLDVGNVSEAGSVKKQENKLKEAYEIGENLLN